MSKAKTATPKEVFKTEMSVTVTLKDFKEGFQMAIDQVVDDNMSDAESKLIVKNLDVNKWFGDDGWKKKVKLYLSQYRDDGVVIDAICDGLIFNKLFCKQVKDLYNTLVKAKRETKEYTVKFTCESHHFQYIMDHLKRKADGVEIVRK